MSERHDEGADGDRRRDGEPNPDESRRGANRRRKRRRGGARRGSGDGSSGAGDLDRPRSRRGRRAGSDRERSKRSADRARGDANKLPRQSYLGFAVLFVLLAGLATAAVFVFLPFVSSLIAAVLITTVGWPLFEFVRGWIGSDRRGLASGLTCLVLLLSVILPAWVLSSALGREVRKWLAAAPEVVAELESAPAVREYLIVEGERDPVWDETLASVERFFGMAPYRLRPPLGAGPIEPVPQDSAVDPPPRSSLPSAESRSDPGFRIPQGGLERLALWMTSSLATLLVGAFGVLIKIALTVFIAFFFFKDGPLILASIESLIPIEIEDQVRVIEKFKDVSTSMVRGVVLTAAAQGVVAGIAFLFLGLQPILWGSLVAISALIPVLGTTMVTVPLTVYFFVTGKTVHGIAAIVVLAVISSLDNVLRPLLVKKGLQLHPVWVLLSILGGVSCFGALGLFLGPMVVVLFRTVLLLVEERQEPLGSRSRRARAVAARAAAEES